MLFEFSCDPWQSRKVFCSEVSVTRDWTLGRNSTVVVYHICSATTSASDEQGFQSRVWGVGVRVWIFRPSKTPTPHQGYRGLRSPVVKKIIHYFFGEMFGLSSVIPYVSSLKCIFHHSSMVNRHIIALKVLWTVIIEKTPGVLVKGMRGRGKGMDIETLQKPVPLVRGRGFGG